MSCNFTRISISERSSDERLTGPRNPSMWTSAAAWQSFSYRMLHLFLATCLSFGIFFIDVYWRSGNQLCDRKPCDWKPCVVLKPNMNSIWKRRRVLWAWTRLGCSKRQWKCVLWSNQRCKGQHLPWQGGHQCPRHEWHAWMWRCHWCKCINIGIL